MTDKTIKFSIKDENEAEMKKNLLAVYEALNEKGYNSISQIVGYILSEDPTYITTHNNPQPCQETRQRRASSGYGEVLSRYKVNPRR